MTDFADPNIASACALPGGSLAFLHERINYERVATVPYSAASFKLDRMRHLLHLLGNPQDQLKVVHVAGTKGKGSTATMIARMLTRAGYRTGLYTSPHLERLEERFVIDNRRCTPQELSTLVEQVRAAVEQMDRSAANTGDATRRPTYFEITTAMAMVYFRAQDVDLAVLEVGMGGRLDSTNICHPLVCVITSISFDHTKQLGNTLALIAAEKAGIIKDGVPVVTGVTEAEPLQVIKEVAARHRCELHQLGRDFSYELVLPGRSPESAPAGAIFDYHEIYSDRRETLPGFRLQLLGDHQAANSAIALRTAVVLRRLGWNLPEAALRDGLAGARCPARIELVCEQPAIILDAAHNVASMEALIAALEINFSGRIRRRTAIFASSRDKDTRGMLRVLLPRFHRVVLTRYLENPRAVPPAELQLLAELVLGEEGCPALRPEVVTCTEPAEAWQCAAAELHADDLLCITGSFYIAAEMRRFALLAHDCSVVAG